PALGIFIDGGQVGSKQGNPEPKRPVQVHFGSISKEALNPRQNEIGLAARGTLEYLNNFAKDLRLKCNDILQIGCNEYTLFSIERGWNLSEAGVESLATIRYGCVPEKSKTKSPIENTPFKAAKAKQSHVDLCLIRTTLSDILLHDQ
ncbi:hypothetical protein GcC1_068016, partial [Golovinomyces cichoracearum]